jgi:hypothetical protein
LANLLGAPGNAPVLRHVGRFQPRKNHGMVIAGSSISAQAQTVERPDCRVGPVMAANQANAPVRVRLPRSPTVLMSGMA